MKSFATAFVILVGLGIAAALVGALVITSRGISARTEPGWIETRVARTMRNLAVPRAERNRPNPVASSPEVFAAAKEHWADHCAVCHGNDGRGNTTLGRGMYPKPPDMRLPETQSLSDGALFYIIENGVRLTGMPAWGAGPHEGSTESWELVHFIRALPSLTPKDLEEMEQMNPRSIRQLREDEEMRRFLKGDDQQQPVTPPPPHKHDGH